MAMYFYLRRKEDLEKLKVDDCQKCEHPTLQMETTRNGYGTGSWRCLTCGTIYTLEYVVSKEK